MAIPYWTSDVQVEDVDFNESEGHHSSPVLFHHQNFPSDTAPAREQHQENQVRPVAWKQPSSVETSKLVRTKQEESPVSAWKPGKSEHELREQVAERVAAEFKNSDFARRLADSLYNLQDGAVNQAQAEVNQLRVENGRLRAQIVKSSMELPLGVSQTLPDGFRNAEAKSALSARPPSAEAPLVVAHETPFHASYSAPVVKAERSIGFADSEKHFYAEEESDRRTNFRQLVRSATIRKDKQQSRRGSTDGGRKAQREGAIFADSDQLKQAVREAIVRPPYSVQLYYKETGMMQAVAKNPYFEYISLFVIAVNSIWLWIDIDFNNAKTINDADVMFQVMEYFFLLFFFTEWLIRFLAFQRKRDGLKDAWFVFDSSLVILMLLDTCSMVFIGGIVKRGNSKASDTNILRLLRMGRITRMARMARLLKALPELTILIKGIWVAARSVFFTLCLLGLLIYVFAVAFRQLTDGTAIGDMYFRSVPFAMKALLLYATLPDMAAMVDTVGEEHILLSIILMLFILLGSLTVMNMLVGVLVEVVSVVSAVEKEEMLCAFVKRQLQDMLEKSGLDADEDMMISRQEFEMLLVKPAAARVIQEVGVDPVGLVDFSDYIFADACNEMLTFREFIDLVLQLRGTNAPTVKDVVDLRKMITQEIAFVREGLKLLTAIVYQIPGAEIVKPHHRKGCQQKVASSMKSHPEVPEEDEDNRKNFRQVLPGEAR